MREHAFHLPEIDLHFELHRVAVPKDLYAYAIHAASLEGVGFNHFVNLLIRRDREERDRLKEVERRSFHERLIEVVQWRLPDLRAQ